jgi:hypothetical protein
MQCSPDDQPQIINYISLRVAKIIFLLLYYPTWNNTFFSFLFTTVNDTPKIYLCIYVHTNNPDQISFVINELSYQEDLVQTLIAKYDYHVEVARLC